MAYAVIRIGGKQFKVKKGDKFHLERQSSAKNEVLLFNDGKNTKIGTPVLKDVDVKLNKVEDKRGKKIRVGRFKSKSRYRKVKGHKQPLSVFEVKSVGKPEKKKTDTKKQTKSTKSKSSKKKTTKKEK
jgi:large subunit ribosomal protein L21